MTSATRRANWFNTPQLAAEQAAQPRVKSLLLGIRLIYLFHSHSFLCGQYVKAIGFRFLSVAALSISKPILWANAISCQILALNDIYII